MVLKSLRLLVTTAQAGADWMICNRPAIIIVQSSMSRKFMSLEEMEQGKSNFQMNETLFISLINFLDTPKFGVTMEVQKASNWLNQY